MYFRYDPFQNVVKEHIYYFYITTNSSKTVLYCGITNSLEHRIVEHYLARGIPKTFTGRYSCYFLIYYEEYDYVEDAISREKEVKKWNRMKKERLIESMNPEKSFLNGELFDQWPPDQRDLFKRQY